MSSNNIKERSLRRRSAKGRHWIWPATTTTNSSWSFAQCQIILYRQIAAETRKIIFFRRILASSRGRTYGRTDGRTPSYRYAWPHLKKCLIGFFWQKKMHFDLILHYWFCTLFLINRFFSLIMVIYYIVTVDGAWRGVSENWVTTGWQEGDKRVTCGWQEGDKWVTEMTR